MGNVSRSEARSRRRRRVRKRIRGTSEKPRLCVFRSARHIYAQIIDDTSSRTLVEASSLTKGLHSETEWSGRNVKGAAVVGAVIAERALEKGIRMVVFDRNGYLYHGRVQALSEAAREKGLEF